MPAIDENKINELLSQMTLEEKVLQLSQYRHFDDDRVRAGLGSRIFADSATAGNDVASKINITENNRQQKIAVEESRLGIPIIHGRDVIHGHRTVFPIPLGMAAGFSPEAVEKAYTFTAVEARAEGVHWTFTPMLDIGRDPRWGRVAEGFGEDSWLCSRLAEAAVRGIQGDDPAQEGRMLACAKHYVAYGACDGGRDYDTASIGRRLLNDVYLPPFEAAVQAGCATIMASFNELDGVPMHANRELMTNLLRDEWGFEGLVVSDWNGVLEIHRHGAAATEKEAALKALKAGVDMDMVSGLYENHLPELVDEGRLGMDEIDTAVRRVLRCKMQLGLFENPYADVEQAQSLQLKPEALEHAVECGRLASVLLVNKNGILPLENKFKTVGLFGPLSQVKSELLGTWTLDGNEQDVVNIEDSMKAAAPSDVKIRTGIPTASDLNSLLPRYGDVNVVCLGEHPLRGGEANSISDIGLPPGQFELLKQIHAQGKPVVAVVVAGRALALQHILPYVDALLFVFHPGVRGGEAIPRALFGDLEPGGRLPVSLPRVTGQVPIYYNRKSTGRPHDPVSGSRYADIPDDPLFSFGYGLSYTRFEYTDIKLASDQISEAGTLEICITITNTGERSGETVAQLYVQHITADVSRPIKELKAFQRVTLSAGESRMVAFKLPATALKYTNLAYERVIGKGSYRIGIGEHSDVALSGGFSVA